jgi:hypothetical protein
MALGLTSWSPYWEANSRSTGQETPCLSCNPDVHYRDHKMPPLEPVMSQINLIHILTPQFYKIHFNIIVPSTSKSSKWSRPFRFSDQIFVRHAFHGSSMRAACPAQKSSLFNHSNISWRRVVLHIMELLIKRLSPASCYFFPLGSKYYLSSAPCSQTLSF